MTVDRPTDPIDDEALSRLVHEVVDGWAMPPVRLDQPGWRQRIRSPRAQRVAALRTAGARLAQAAVAGVVLTVGAALVGVYLTSPHDVGKPGTSPDHSAGPRPSAVAASPLPKLFIEGEAPTPGQVVVKVESSYSIVDLTQGVIGSPIARGEWGSDLRRNSAGTLVCLCLEGEGYTTGGYTRLTAVFVEYDASGAETRRHPIGAYEGTPDPRGATADMPQHVAARVSYSPDGGLAFVGWSGRAHPAWNSGIDVVDPLTGRVLGGVTLPSRSDGDGNNRVFVDAPRVIGLSGDGRYVIAQPWYSWSPATSQNPTYHFGTDVFVADANGKPLANLEPLAGAADCGETVDAAGPLDDGTWLACTAGGGGATVVRRIDADGAHDVRVSAFGVGGDPGSTLVASRDGRSLFLWNAVGLTLTRVDLATGEVSTGSGSAAAEGPLAALGRWLTPAAAAKVLLSSGIAMSPDGSRIYALGVDPSAAQNDELAGSRGIYVFDTATLAEIGHWDAVADFVSVAVSADGRFVYAAGSPAPGSGYGAGVSQQAASVTVYDAATGEVRLIAGQLGSSFLLFPSTIVR